MGPSFPLPFPRSALVESKLVSLAPSASMADIERLFPPFKQEDTSESVAGMSQARDDAANGKLLELVRQLSKALISGTVSEQSVAMFGEFLEFGHYQNYDSESMKLALSKNIPVPSQPVPNNSDAVPLWRQKVNARMMLLNEPTKFIVTNLQELRKPARTIKTSYGVPSSAKPSTQKRKKQESESSASEDFEESSSESDISSESGALDLSPAAPPRPPVTVKGFKRGSHARPPPQLQHAKGHAARVAEQEPAKPMQSQRAPQTSPGDSRDKKFRCDMCSYASSDSSNFIRHKRTHTGEKPFQCDMCSFACSDSSALTRHKRTHTR